MGQYELDDYKDVVNRWLNSLPKKGHGQFRKMALFLGVNSTVVSQIFRGPRDLSMEQALNVVEFMGLSKLEKEHFLLLVARQRAGTEKLRRHYTSQIVELRERALNTKMHINDHKELSDTEKAIFYSSWSYSAVRLVASLEGQQTVRAIAERLDLPFEKTQKIIDFLIEYGLLNSSEGRLSKGPATTFIDKDSRFVSNHLRNWRLKSLERVESLNSDDYMFSSLTSLSEQDALAVRQILIDSVSKVYERVKSSKEETLAFLNIDWIKL